MTQDLEYCDLKNKGDNARILSYKSPSFYRLAISYRSTTLMLAVYPKVNVISGISVHEADILRKCQLQHTTYFLQPK